MNDKPLDLDKHRGMAAQKATDIRRALAEVENNATQLRERQSVVESQLLSVQAASWPEAIGKTPKVLFIDLIEDRDHGMLDDLILQRRDAQRALPPVGLRYIDSP